MRKIIAVRIQRNDIHKTSKMKSVVTEFSLLLRKLNAGLNSYKQFYKSEKKNLKAYIIAIKIVLKAVQTKYVNP